MKLLCFLVAVLILVVASLSAGVWFSGYQLKRINDTIDGVRESIPMSVLGN